MGFGKVVILHDIISKESSCVVSSNGGTTSTRAAKENYDGGTGSEALRLVLLRQNCAK